MQRQRAWGVSGQQLQNPLLHPLVEDLIKKLVASCVVESRTIPLVEPKNQPDVLQEKWRPELLEAVTQTPQTMHGDIAPRVKLGPKETGWTWRV